MASLIYADNVMLSASYNQNLKCTRNKSNTKWDENWVHSPGHSNPSEKRGLLNSGEGEESAFTEGI